MVLENEQGVSWQEGISCPLTSCGYKQSWELLPLMVSSFCSVLIGGLYLGEAQMWCLDLCRQKMPGLTWMVGLPWREQGLLAICILLGSKKKEPGANICLKGNWFQCGKLFTWFTAHLYPSDSALEPTSQKPKRSDKIEGQCALSCSSLWSRTVAKTQCSPFLPVTLPYQG